MALELAEIELSSILTVGLGWRRGNYKCAVSQM